MQSQRDGGMEVESCECRNVTNQQQDSAPPDTLHSEHLPDTSDQQSRCFTQDQTSVAQDEGRIHLHLQNTNESLEKSGCCKFRFLCYEERYKYYNKQKYRQPGIHVLFHSVILYNCMFEP